MNASVDRPFARVRGSALRRAMSLVTLAWIFGCVWQTATAGAPLTEFARGLGASNFQFGLLSALPFVASLICIPASYLTERTGKRKGIFLWTLYAQRIMWIPLALVPLWMMHYGGSVASWAADGFLLMMFIMYAVGNVGGPAWVSWMADLVPDGIRGKYFSVRRQLGIVSGIPAAVLVGAYMDHHSPAVAMMSVCAMIFLWSAPFGCADIHMFQYVPEIPQPPRRTHWLGTLAKPLRDRQFLYFAGFVAMLTFAISFMGQFVTLYLEEEVHATNLGTQLITLVAPMLAQLLVLNIWGMAVDRMGKKPVLAIAAAGLAPVGLGWCFMTTSRIWLGYLLSALGGMLWCGIEVANFNLVLEMSGRDEAEGGSNFFAVNNVIINIAGCIGGLTAGWIAQEFRTMQWQPIASWRPLNFYDILFALSGILRLGAALMFLPFIHEPTARPTHATLRFVTSNIYNNLFQAVLLPLRLAGFAKLQEKE